ncbi:MAG: oligosaccharide flippase family protein [Candidatus Buchananbacteria bacterium]
MAKSLKERLIKIFQGNFVKDTAILQVGNVFSTGLTFVASLVFARVLGPNNYGQYVLIFSFANLMATFMHWGADYATTTLLAEAWAKRDKIAVKNIIVFYVKIFLLISVSVGLLVIIFSTALANYFYHNPLIGSLAVWVVWAGIINSFFALVTIILQVARKIKHLTVIENINKVSDILLPIIFVLLGFGLKGLVTGLVVSAFIFFVISYYFYEYLLTRTDLLPSFGEIYRGLRQVVVKEYFKFGFLIAVDKNLASLYSTLPMFFAGIFISNAELGFFKIASSYLGLSLIILKPVSRLLVVQLPKSRTYGQRTLKDHFFKTTIYSFIIVTLTIVPMLLVGPFLVRLFYGVKYLPTVEVIYWLWPYVIVSSLGVSLSALFRTINRMRVTIITNAVILFLTVPLAYLAIKTYGLKGLIITTIGLTFLPIMSLIVYAYKYFDQSSNSE